MNGCAEEHAGPRPPPTQRASQGNPLERAEQHDAGGRADVRLAAWTGATAMIAVQPRSPCRRREAEHARADASSAEPSAVTIATVTREYDRYRGDADAASTSREAQAISGCDTAQLPSSEVDACVGQATEPKTCRHSMPRAIAQTPGSPRSRRPQSAFAASAIATAKGFRST